MKTLAAFFLISLLTGLFSCKTAQMERKFKRDKSILVKQLDEMVIEDQKYRNMLTELRKEELGEEVYKKKYDSLWALQETIDNRNIEKMIEITKKYGFPNPDRLGAPIATWVILQHTPEAYTEEVKVLAAREYKAGRLYHNEYQMISWHLNGRKGLPFGLKGVEIRDLRTHN